MTIVGAILSLLSTVIGLLRERKLMDAGEAVAAERGLRYALEATKRANQIRRGVAVAPRSDIDDLLRPPDRR